MTRCGEEVTQITVFENMKVDTYPVFAEVGGRVITFTLEGKETVGGIGNDLYMAPVIVERWTLLKKGEQSFSVSFSSKKEAEQQKTNHLLHNWAVVKLTWEE